MPTNETEDLTRREMIGCAIFVIVVVIVFFALVLPTFTLFLTSVKTTSSYYYEIVVVEEITTDIRVSNPLVIHLFKGNSSITDEWIMAKANSGWMNTRYFAVQIGDFIEVKWRIRSIGYVFESSKKLEV